MTTKLNETAVLKCELEPIYQGLEANFKVRVSESKMKLKYKKILNKFYFHSGLFAQKDLQKLTILQKLFKSMAVPIFN